MSLLLFVWSINGAHTLNDYAIISNTLINICQIHTASNVFDCFCVYVALIVWRKLNDTNFWYVHVYNRILRFLNLSKRKLALFLISLRSVWCESALLISWMNGSVCTEKIRASKQSTGQFPDVAMWIGHEMKWCVMFFSVFFFILNLPKSMRFELKITAHLARSLAVLYYLFTQWSLYKSLAIECCSERKKYDSSKRFVGWRCVTKKRGEKNAVKMRQRWKKSPFLVLTEREQMFFV